MTSNDVLLAYFFQRRRTRRNIIHRPLERTHAAFSINEIDFMKVYRLSKHAAWQLIEAIKPHVPIQKKISDLPAESRVLIALRFYAQGSYQLSVGRDMDLNVSQSSVSRCIGLVSKIITNRLSPTWIRFPNNVEKPAVKAKFYEKFRFPGVVGVIDCTHIAIVAPNVLEHVYVNRKGYHSMNVQLICDADGKIINANAKFPGSVHDAHIWQQSAIKDHLNQEWLGGERSSWLLGDSGYPLEPYLITPFPEQSQDETERRFNRKFKVTRSLIEQVNGQLKARFRCLMKHRVLHYSPKRAAEITIACCVLHNICKAENLPDVEVEVEEGDEDAAQGAPDGSLLAAGREQRRRISNMMFN